METLKITFKHPDTFSVSIDSPSKFFGKKVYSSFLRLQGFWFNKNFKVINITCLSTLLSFVKYVVEEHRSSVTLSKGNDYIKEKLDHYNLWLYNQLLED